MADELNGGATGSRFTSCPICGKSVAVLAVNSHIDACIAHGKDEEGNDGKEEEMDIDEIENTLTPAASSSVAPFPTSAATPSAAIPPRKSSASLFSPRTPKRTAKSNTSKKVSVVVKKAKLLNGDALPSRFTTCPICMKDVPVRAINMHLDFQCGRAEEDEEEMPALERPGSASSTHDPEPQTPSSRESSSSSSNQAYSSASEARGRVGSSTTEKSQVLGKNEENEPTHPLFTKGALPGMLLPDFSSS